MFDFMQVFGGRNTNTSDKMTTSQPSTMWRRSDIKNPQLLPKTSGGAKTDFRSPGRPLECVGARKKSGLREKVGIASKKLASRVKKPAAAERV